MKRNVLFLLVSFLLFSCKDDNTKLPADKQAILYSVGVKNAKIKLWKDNNSSTIHDSLLISNAFSIYVNESDVYISGIEKNSNNRYVAKVWKNGIPQILTNLNETITESFAKDIFISKNKTYVVGYETVLGNRARIWIDGIKEELDGGSKGHVSSSANAIKISNDIVYVAGTSGKNGKNIASIWKNNTFTPLSEDTKNSEANDIAILGDDVYVVGNEENGNGSVRVAVLWKNGKKQELTKGLNSNTASANSIALKDNDIYIVGFERKNNGAIVAMLWKNKVPQELTDDATSSNDARANSIVIYKNDIYIGGFKNGKAAIWKNGKIQNLTDANAAVINDLALGFD